MTVTLDVGCPYYQVDTTPINQEQWTCTGLEKTKLILWIPWGSHDFSANLEVDKANLVDSVGKPTILAPTLKQTKLNLWIP